MSALFSAYVRPFPTMGRRVARAGLVSVAVLVCLAVSSRLRTGDAPLITLAGAMVWGSSMAFVFLLPNRVTFGFAIFGAMLAGTGSMAAFFGSTCWCERSDDTRAVIRRFLTGEAEPQQLTLSCF